MLVETVSKIDCKQGQVTFEQATDIMKQTQDELFQKVTEVPLIDNIKEYLLNLIPNTNILGVDIWGVYLGQGHSHLVGFLRGCSLFSVELDHINTVDLLRLLGLNI